MGTASALVLGSAAGALHLASDALEERGGVRQVLRRLDLLDADSAGLPGEWLSTQCAQLMCGH